MVYSKDYGRIWRYWLTNPDDLPEPDGWRIVKRINGCNVVINPVPPDRIKKLGNLVAVIAAAYVVLDAMDGRIDGIIHMCRVLAGVAGVHV